MSASRGAFSGVSRKNGGGTWEQRAHLHSPPPPRGSLHSSGVSLPSVVGRKQSRAPPSPAGGWPLISPAVESEITSSNYGRIWKLFVPPTFPPAQELISPQLSPLGPECGAPGPWCPRKLFLIANYCPLELMVALNHRTLIWGVLSHWNGLPFHPLPQPRLEHSPGRCLPGIYMFKPNHTSDTVLFER